MFFYNNDSNYPQVKTSDFMYKVYAWMCAALFLTAITAYFVVTSPSVAAFIFKPMVMLGLGLGSFILVIMLSAMIRQLSFTTAIALFFAYAVLLGCFLSSIFVVYTQASIYSTFVVASGMFGVTALYGVFTKNDLSSIGSYAIMALWGIILAMIVNIFLRSSQFDFLISLVGVAVFVLLTAADMQKIKMLASQLIADQETVDKIALYCALTLYLDFINLFLFLLRLLGKRRD